MLPTQRGRADVRPDPDAQFLSLQFPRLDTDSELAAVARGIFVLYCRK